MRAVRWMVGAAATCVVLFAPAASAMAATPALTLTPGFGPPGVSVTVKGSGFGATEAVDVYFDSTDMVVAATSSTGAFSTSFTVPAATPTGTHWVSAVGRASGLSAQHSFGVHENWPEFGYNALGQRANPYETALNASNVGNLEEAWSYTTGGAIVSSPAVVNGVVYVGSSDGNVYSFNAATGKLRWTATTGASVQSSPAVVGGTVYVGSRNGSVYALNSANGSVRWSDDLSGLEPGGFDASPTVANATVYIGGRSGILYALDAKVGFAEWAAPTGGAIESAPVAAGGRIFVSSRDGNVYGFNAANGSQLWTHAVGPPISDFDVSAGVALSNGRLFVAGAFDGFYSALRATSGGLLWDAAENGNEVFASPAVANGAVYHVEAGDGPLISLSATNGSQNYDVTDDAGFSSPAYANGVLYFGAVDNLAAARASDGTVLWTGDLGGIGVRSSPAVSDGSVYIGDDQGTIHAYRLNGSLAAITRPAIGRLYPDRSLPVTHAR
jgi:outer membrane protein assembly factor BamB